MRYIALEEAFTIPELPRLSPVYKKGTGTEVTVGIPFWPDFVASVEQRLPDLTGRRLQEMDEAGIDMQVLSLTVPGVQQELKAGEAIEAARQRRVQQALEGGPQAVAGEARLALLSDPVALSRLHLQVWEGGHENWLEPWRKSVQADAHSPALPLAPPAGAGVGLPAAQS